MTKKTLSETDICAIQRAGWDLQDQIAEQCPIVGRVESLRRLCTDLRQRLSASQTKQAHLA